MLAIGAAHAQKPAAPFPARPVRLLVTQAAGGPTDVEALTPQQLGAKLARDHERWGKVVMAAGMKPN